MGVRTYNADEVTVVLAGVPVSLTKGYADGDFIRVERESPVYEDHVGVDGEVTRTRTKDNRATVTLSLMSSSETNELLSTLYQLDRNLAGGAGVGPLLIRDGSGPLVGTTLFTAESCWISQPPTASMDRVANAREWTFRVANLIDFHGSNNFTE